MSFSTLDFYHPRIVIPHVRHTTYPTLLTLPQALRTNLRRRPPPGAFIEAHYTQASALLRGQPLTRGQEMGGFKLGSTVVMVFEAPRGFQFTVKPGEKVKVGQAFGDVFAV